MNFKLSDSTLRLTVAFLAAATLAYVAQLHYDLWRRWGSPKLNVSYNEFIEPQPISAESAKLVNFGAREALADWYWLSLIQYYGGGEPYGRYRKLPELFNLVTELSPKFLQAYQTGLIILPGEGFVDEAIALGEKGKKNLAESWEIPYYTGLAYHIYKKDYIAAAKEFELAAAKEDAPPIARYFVGIYYNLGNQRQLAYEIFRTVAATTDSDFIRERSQKYIQHLEIVFYLEDAVAKYKEQFARAPESLEQLVQANIINEIPASPLAITLTIDPNTGEVKETKS